MSGQFDDLIARLEAASGPDRGLDGDVAVACGEYSERHGLPNGGWVSRGPHHAVVAAPSYTASIDCALTLVPEGWNHLTFEHIEDTWGCFLDADDTNAATPAIALVIAALKARAALAKASGRDGGE